MKATLISCCCLLLFSCRETNVPAEAVAFYFEAPQPINDSQLQHIPSKFVGTYRDKDSVLLQVEKKLIYSESFFSTAVHQSELDSVMVFFKNTDGKLVEKETGAVWESFTKGDSVTFRSKWRDTLFEFSTQQQAKRTHGKLVLNFKKDTLWKVKVLTLEDDILTIRSFGLPADRAKWDSVTRLPSRVIDSSEYVLQPSRKEFNTMLKIKVLGYDSRYKKVP